MKYIVIGEEINGPSRHIVSAHEAYKDALVAARNAVDSSGFGYRVVEDYAVSMDNGRKIMASEMCAAPKAVSGGRSQEEFPKWKI